MPLRLRIVGPLCRPAGRARGARPSTIQWSPPADGTATVTRPPALKCDVVVGVGERLPRSGSSAADRPRLAAAAATAATDATGSRPASTTSRAATSGDGPARGAVDARGGGDGKQRHDDPLAVLSELHARPTVQGGNATMVPGRDRYGAVWWGPVRSATAGDAVRIVAVGPVAGRRRARSAPRRDVRVSAAVGTVATGSRPSTSLALTWKRTVPGRRRS